MLRESGPAEIEPTTCQSQVQRFTADATTQHARTLYVARQNFIMNVCKAGLKYTLVSSILTGVY